MPTGADQKVEREPARPSTTSVYLCSSKRLRSDHPSGSSTSTSWWPLPLRSARSRGSSLDGRGGGSRRVGGHPAETRLPADLALPVGGEVAVELYGMAQGLRYVHRGRVDEER